MIGKQHTDGQQQTATRRLVMRLLRDYVSRHKGRLALAIFCMMVVAAASGLSVKMLQYAVDNALIEGDPTWRILVPVAFVVIGFINALASFGQGYLVNGVSQRIATDVQADLHRHLIYADLGYHNDEATGRLISRFLVDASLLNEATGKAITGLVKDSLMAMVLIGVMFATDWRLAAASLVVFPLVLYPLSRLGKRMRKVSRQIQEQAGDFTALLDTTFAAVRQVKAYAMEEFEIARAEKSLQDRLKVTLKALRLRSAASPMMEFIGSLAAAVVLWYGSERIVAGEMTTGELVAFIASLLYAYRPLKSLATLNTALQLGLGAADRLFKALDHLPAIADNPGAKPLRITEGRIEFRHVSFAYEDGGRDALRGIDLAVAPGQTVALVGPSGGGKSTILNLIPRFYDVRDGAVLIDGQDVREVTLSSLRSAIGLVSQDTALFNGTIRDNIAYGRQGAGDEEIVAAAKAADAHDFIMRLPRGYDTQVGDAGSKLSGGQRQRINIARAMLKNAPILLLDEATSALDSEAEKKVQAALSRLMEGRTTLVVAHRLSTVIGADRIYVVENGSIVESGTHEELLARQGRYSALYRTQHRDEAQPVQAPSLPSEGVA